MQERLKPFLPEGEELPSTAAQLEETVKSPQFRQALHSFSEALATGQLASVLKQFGLPASAQEAASKGGSLHTIRVVITRLGSGFFVDSSYFLYFGK